MNGKRLIRRRRTRALICVFTVCSDLSVRTLWAKCGIYPRKVGLLVIGQHYSGCLLFIERHSIIGINFYLIKCWLLAWKFQSLSVFCPSLKCQTTMSSFTLTDEHFKLNWKKSKSLKQEQFILLQFVYYLAHLEISRSLEKGSLKQQQQQQQQLNNIIIIIIIIIISSSSNSSSTTTTTTSHSNR